ncbi:MAG: hypothetical protein A2297_07050 [Elusimicrobia bacterium RIFOXYB2_FULL_48_7]|nr:MAG: hypothetical protein A2297_07050 [Elusimicrobia bacterium RIFOXYB2_FULL_48_7]
MTPLKKVIQSAAIILILLGITANCYATIGLGTKFATVILEKLEPGKVYNLRELRNLPLTVINSGSEETDVIVEAEIPEKSELREGYEPIADTAFIKFVPNKFRIKAGEEYPCDVIIAIPADNSLIGKHFQAKIWTHTGGSDIFGAGVVNRIFFSIGAPGPESAQKAKKNEILTALNFDTEPRDIYLTIPAGRKIDLMKELDKTIKLVNKARDKITVKLESVDYRKNGSVVAQLRPGYEFTPDKKLLAFKPENTRINANSIKDAGMYIRIPADEKYYGKKFMFVARVTPVKPELPIEFYTRIFVTVNNNEQAPKPKR